MSDLTTAAEWTGYATWFALAVLAGCWALHVIDTLWTRWTDARAEWVDEWTDSPRARREDADR